MAAPIGPGDFLECVAGTGDGRLVPGRIYRCETVDIRGLFCAFDGCRHGGIRVAGAKTKYSGFCINRFRPIYRPKSEIVEALKAPPKRIREREAA